MDGTKYTIGNSLLNDEFTIVCRHSAPVYRLKEMMCTLNNGLLYIVIVIMISLYVLASEETVSNAGVPLSLRNGVLKYAYLSNHWELILPNPARCGT
jgi:hypothetical protein